MMSEIETPEGALKSFNWRKLVLQLAVGFSFGGLAGYGGAFLVDQVLVTGGLEAVPISAGIALFVAVVYLLFGVFVLAGLVNPRLGAKVLNVEDADEIAEQKSELVNSGLGMVLWGGALAALALADPVGPLSALAALLLAAVGLLGGLWFGWRAYRGSDELMLAVNLEAGALTYALVLAVLGGWGMLAHLGYAAGPQPLDLLTVCYVLVLVATYIAIGRRGMFTVR
ncbi:MAG: hypothetical protein ACJLS3_13950 [Erythrobacter sp.]